MASVRYLRAIALITLSSLLFACGIWPPKADVASKPLPIARSLYDFTDIAAREGMVDKATRTWGSA